MNSNELLSFDNFSHKLYYFVYAGLEMFLLLLFLFAYFFLEEAKYQRLSLPVCIALIPMFIFHCRKYKMCNDMNCEFQYDGIECVELGRSKEIRYSDIITVNFSGNVFAKFYYYRMSILLRVIIVVCFPLFASVIALQTFLYTSIKFIYSFICFGRINFVLRDVVIIESDEEMLVLWTPCRQIYMDLKSKLLAMSHENCFSVTKSIFFLPKKIERSGRGCTRPG